jgi:hypothetical protein
MAASNELRRRLTELTQRFVDDVLRAIERAPMQEVAANLPRGSSPPATVSGDDEEAAERRYIRRTSGEIQRVREVILESLRSAKRPVAASDIARAAGVRTADLAFPMAQLREQGLVDKNGNRAQAVYWLTDREDDDRDGETAERDRKRKKKKGKR